MTTLKEFIKETLTQITEAVSDFGAEHQSSGASPNPALAGPLPVESGLFSSGFNDTTRRFDTIMPVSFDVAVSAEESTAAGGGAGIRVLSFISAEGKLSTETVAGSVSRVSFRIPLRLPDTGDHGKPDRSRQRYAITDEDDYAESVLTRDRGF